MTVALRLLTEADLPQVMRWRMLPEITRYMYSDPVLTPEGQRRWFDRIDASPAEVAWIVTIDAVPVGLLSLSGLDRDHRRCAWAYYLAEPAARGVGLARTLECNVCDFVFQTLGLNKLECEVFAFNDRVVKLHELFGARVEGVLRQHIFKAGAFHDVVRMGLLGSEWMERRSRLNYAPIDIEVPEKLRQWPS